MILVFSDSSVVSVSRVGVAYETRRAQRTTAARTRRTVRLGTYAEPRVVRYRTGLLTSTAARALRRILLAVGPQTVTGDEAGTFFVSDVAQQDAPDGEHVTLEFTLSEETAS